jgi:hypothetical protein
LLGSTFFTTPESSPVAFAGICGDCVGAVCFDRSCVADSAWLDGIGFAEESFDELVAEVSLDGIFPDDSVEGVCADDWLAELCDDALPVLEDVDCALALTATHSSPAPITPVKAALMADLLGADPERRNTARAREETAAPLLTEGKRERGGGLGKELTRRWVIPCPSDRRSPL